ncbi:phosphopantetheine-binding protein [Cellulosimicrobium protaetiae]|uniref:Isochorismatase n=1 Tax=Cellulosimicrobium protaetiae TaxID=2587808 RepID=A0A6M5UF16_9MICO|nr:phosphopantetheine-binding protein [Cellulosimicrobium protaetiae]QJW35855.1 isochorismatase [Cellulosimicrobium protaetiae]
MTTTAPPTREQALADLAEVLGAGASAPEIGLDDDLTDHGLDSVRLMALVERWRGAGWPVEFAQVAVDPTLRGCLRALGVPHD